ncbi:hypothetical protein DPEC_G00073980 [Dallia pectoralis]|uniref:Uncharacterized protein n=1 Tax=Dallia pectoralis TaxID=75939 RepID=A0ACC2H2T5_DALPE|nr:hypothetical protein DPEC_G00073980 [Dallia pectoralis]
MGNCCCPAVSSCNNEEERSGLLPGGVKVPASSSESVHNGSGAHSEMRKTGVENGEASEEKEEADVTTQMSLCASDKYVGEEDSAKTLTILENGLLYSPNTNTEVVANSLLTAPDKCTKETDTLDCPATVGAPVEAKRCLSDLPQSPDKDDPRVGAVMVPDEKTDVAVLANVTFTEVHDMLCHEVTVASDAQGKFSETSAIEAVIAPEHLTSETVVEGCLLSQPEESCSVAMVVASVSDTQLTTVEACDGCVTSQGNSFNSSVTTDLLPHLHLSSVNSVMKDLDDGDNMISVACIDDSLNVLGCGNSEDPERSSAVTETTEPTKNSRMPEPVPTSPPGASQSLNLIEDEKSAGQCRLPEVPCLVDFLEGAEVEDLVESKQEAGKEKEETEDSSPVTDALLTEMGGEEGQKGEDHKLTTVADVKVDVKEEVLLVRKEDIPVVEDLVVSEEDLYLGAEELCQGPAEDAGPKPLFENALPKDRCSLEPMVDILFYSQKEWKGSTDKSALIRKGYTELSRRFGCLRRVRGDNYCALRATLFQVFSTCTQSPVWLTEEHTFTWMEVLEEPIGQWTFPSGCRQGEESEDSAQQLKRYVKLLQNRWEAAAVCSSVEEKQRLCEQIFQGGEEELGMLEALKLLMLVQASELHAAMQGGEEVPVFCWLLFARDSSDHPRTFLSNHLSKVGFSGGLEQVEMFLLGYTLQCTIQVYRLYMTDTEEFVTYYPDDHKTDWPIVCLVTEDDRHYNIPVGQPNGLQTPEDPASISQDLTAD